MIELYLLNEYLLLLFTWVYFLFHWYFLTILSESWQLIIIQMNKICALNVHTLYVFFSTYFHALFWCWKLLRPFQTVLENTLKNLYLIAGINEISSTPLSKFTRNKYEKKNIAGTNSVIMKINFVAISCVIRIYLINGSIYEGIN